MLDLDVVVVLDVGPVVVLDDVKSRPLVVLYARHARFLWLQALVKTIAWGSSCNSKLFALNQALWKENKQI